MMMMISASDLISLYIGLELQSLSLYVIAAFRRDSVQSSEAGLKYFVLGALSSGMMLYGCSMVYGFAGTTSFDTLGQQFANGAPYSVGLVIGIVFVSVGLAFKVSAVPFHMWTPDVYEGAPTPVTAFFAVAPKIAAITLFVRVMLEPFGALTNEWRQIIWFISVASVILCMRRDGRMVEGIADLAGLSRTHPGLALAMAIFMFSMAGIPPLAGFF